MPLLTNQASWLLGGGRRAPWETGGGTIPIANVIYAKKLTAQREQATAGLPLTGAWSVAFRTILASVPVPPPGALAFDAESGRVLAGAVASVPNGYLLASTNYNVGLFASGDHTYMLISTGSSVQAYRDNVAVGAAVASAVDIGGAVRWRSRYATDGASWYDWAAAMPGAEICNIALDATQRAGLHASMMALPSA